MKRSLLAIGLLAGCSTGGGTGSTDMARPPDLAQKTIDLAELPDLAQPPDDLAQTSGDLAGQPCNSVIDVSFGLTCQQTPLSPPQPMGGPIPDGTYTLVDCVFFTGQGGAQGPIGPKQFQTLVLANGGYQVVGHGDMDPESRATGTVSTMNSNITITPMCPSVAAPTTSTYTAYQTSFSVMANGGNNITILYTYAKK